MSASSLRLRCVSLGPQRQGRDYGSYPQSRIQDLKGEAQARLNDFAMALLRWGFTPQPAFSIFFPLDDEGASHFLARVAYLREDTLGPTVIANAVLLSPSDLASIDHAPHRLLPAILDPLQGPWASDRVQMPLPPPGASGPDQSLTSARAELELLAEVLPHCDAQVRVEVAEGLPVADVLRTLLGGEMAFEQGLNSWASTASLERKGRFDPATLKLLAYPPPRQGKLLPGRLLLTAKGLQGQIPELSPQARAIQLIFVRSFTSAQRQANPWLDEIILRAKRVRAGPDVSIRILVRDVLCALIAPVAIQRDRFWLLMTQWSDAAANLPKPDHIEAQLGVAIAFRAMFDSASSRDAKEELLHGYLEHVEKKLPDGPPALPVTIVASERMTADVGARDLALLVTRGLGRADPDALIEPLRERRYRPDQAKAIASALQHMILDEGDVGSIPLARLFVTAATPATAAARSYFATVADTTIRLGTDLLMSAAGHDPDWPELSDALAKQLGAVPQGAITAKVLPALRGALRDACFGEANAVPAGRTCLAHYSNSQRIAD